MPRRPRVDFPGAWHHVMHRGVDGGAPLFGAPDRCALFLDTVAEVVARHAIEVHAYALVPDQFHLLVRSRHGNLSDALRDLVGRCSRRLNRASGHDGPVFRGRFRSQLVMDEAHRRHLVAYLHLSPVRAHLARHPDEPCWTSHRALTGREPAPPWLGAGALALFGGASKLHDHVHGVHAGRAALPDELDGLGWFPAPPRTSRLGDGATPASTSLPMPPARAPATPSPDAVLDRVAAVTGSTLAGLRTALRGRGANPARRFAVLVLAHQPGLRHEDVGALLAMTRRQVANVVQRAKGRPLDPRLAAWHKALAGGAG